ALLQSQRQRVRYPMSKLTRRWQTITGVLSRAILTSGGSISTSPPYSQLADYTRFITHITTTGFPETLGYQIPLTFPDDGTIPFPPTTILGQSLEPSSTAIHRYSTSTSFLPLHGILDNNVSP